MKNNGIKVVVIIFVSLLIGVVSGLFGGGGGMLCIPLLKDYLKLDDKTSHATTVMAMGIITIPTFFVYLFTIEQSILATIFITIGVLFGSIIGTKFLKKISPKALSILFILVTTFSAIKLLFF